MRRVVLLIGLAEHVCGYLGLWLVASGRAVLPYWGMVGLTVMAFNGSNWIDTACIATNVHNFPGDRGSVVGNAPTSKRVCKTWEACIGFTLQRADCCTEHSHAHCVLGCELEKSRSHRICMFMTRRLFLRDISVL